MRRYQRFSCLVLLCLIGTLCPACGGNPAFLIDPTHSYPFEGWGTSLAWWAEVLGQWSDATNRAALEDALFNPDTGLGLNVIRYNFGASTPDNQCVANSFRIGGSVPSDLPPNKTDEQSVNLNADLAQLKVLQDAQARGANIFEGFANSAPDWMLVHKCTQGNDKSSTNNLSMAHEQDYANYLATLVQAFSKAGITFRTVEPFNEPDGEWKAKDKGDHGGQEGMHVDPDQQERVIQHFIHCSSAEWSITLHICWCC